MRKASPYVILWISCTQYLRRSVRTSSSPWSRSDWWEAPRTATVRGEGGSVIETKGRFDLDKLRDRTSAGAGAPKVGAQGPPRRLAICIRSCYYIYAIRNLQKLTEGACGKPAPATPPSAQWPTGGASSRDMDIGIALPSWQRPCGEVLASRRPRGVRRPRVTQSSLSPS